MLELGKKEKWVGVGGREEIVDLEEAVDRQCFFLLHKDKEHLLGNLCAFSFW